MESLPDELLQEFMKGNHVMRHIRGLWNGIWSDMFIESTFMRYGHEAGGLVGLTLKPAAVTAWALSLHVCSQLCADLSSMKDGPGTKEMTTHKEESIARIHSDALDREKLRSTLALFIDPIDPTNQPSGIVNVASGLMSPNTVNVDKSLEIGKEQMRDFESGWPDTFHGTLKKKTVTMAASKKAVKIAGTPVYDTELIYTRVLGLQQSRNLNKQTILTYELSATPPALFDENGDMRSQTKATLRNQLKVEISNRRTSPPDAIIIDGCAYLWSVHWPTSGTVETYIQNFVGSLQYHLQKCAVYLIFDRYPPATPKGYTRCNRSGKNVTRRHVLTLNTPLPPQKIVLNVTHNKKQLITLITEYLIHHVANSFHNELIITSEHRVPIAIKNGEISTKDYLQNSQEEADVIIPHQLVFLAGNGAKHVCIICDDTDVFILLVHFYCKLRLECGVTMESPIAGRSSIDIKATAQRHKDVSEYLPGMHALTGCDTTSFVYSIGKVTALKILRKGTPLKLLGMEGSNMEDVVQEATVFISTCYGVPGMCDMSETRYAAWSVKMANSKICSAPILKALPPTSDAFRLHVYRPHLQAMIWRSALTSTPPAAADPSRHGWVQRNNSLFPVMLPEDVSPVPLDVLQMVKCGCASTYPCSSGRCSCVTAQMSCSMFCACHAGPDCNNKHTRSQPLSDYDDEC